MDSEKLKQIEDIYHAVLEIPLDERESFLDESCGEDIELRREVESLLSFNKTSDEILNSPPEQLVAEMLTETADIDDIIGKRIRHYKIIRLLGKGGMGEVYLAEDKKLDRRTALKILPADFAKDSERMSRFVQEAKAVSALNHPNILTIYEIGEAEDLHFIATEYIEGVTLNDYTKEKPLKFKSALDIAVQIASALVAAHEAGIIHRDIKPDNVMIRNDGIVKVLDFGLAKPIIQNFGAVIDREGATRQKVMTKAGMIMGTPKYMSPEQARGQNVDSRTDIFSFGIVLYEMIASKPPFSGESDLDTIGAILKEEPKPLKEFFPEVPVDLENLIGKALRKDREQRYQNIKDLYIDLKDIRDTVETDIKLVTGTKHDIAAQTLKTNNSIVSERRFSLIHAVVFILFIVASVGIIWWLTASSGSVIKNESQLKTEEIVNWTSKPGEVYSGGSFSPDAKMVAFISTKGGSRGIWVKRTTSGEAVQITKDEVDYKHPIWSPNGEELAFYSSKGRRAGFWKMPILGGTPKLIKAIDDGSSRLLFWSQNNRIYYESEGNVYTVDADSGQVKQITNLSSDAIARPSISVSPDEKSLVYTMSENNIWSLWTAGINGQSPEKIYSSESEIRNTAWHPDNKRLFFSRLIKETFQIFVTDINGGSPQQLTFFEQDVFVEDISSDGSKILYGWAKEESNIWKVDIADSKELNVVSEIDSELWADVSPDGKNIAYQSIKNLSQGNKLFYGKILTKNLDKNEDPFELADSGFLPKWSPDGQTIAFISISGSQYRLETIKSSGSEKKLLTGGLDPVSFSTLPYNRIQTSDISWSPDSAKIIYLSYRSGQSNIWIINADGSNDSQLTKNRDSKLILQSPLWSADGNQIAFTIKTNQASGKIKYSVCVIDVETKKTKIITVEDSFTRLIGWSSDGYELILASVEDTLTTALRTEVMIKKVNIETGRMQEITKLEDAYQYNIHLSPDKTKIAFVANREDKDNIWLIAVTGGEAKQITGNNDSRLYFSSLAWSPDNNSIFFGRQTRYSLLSMLTDFK